MVWRCCVIEPFPDGTCRVYEVRTLEDESFSVSEPTWHWTNIVLFGESAHEPEPGQATPDQTVDTAG